MKPTATISLPEQKSISRVRTCGKICPDQAVGESMHRTRDDGVRTVSLKPNLYTYIARIYTRAGKGAAEQCCRTTPPTFRMPWCA